MDRGEMVHLQDYIYSIGHIGHPTYCTYINLEYSLHLNMSAGFLMLALLKYIRHFTDRIKKKLPFLFDI